MKTIFIEEHTGPNIFELPNLDDAIVIEVKPGSGPKPKAYCSKCKTNWACLHSEIENEECYDSCPTCRTDAYLEEYHAHEDGFICSPFTGEIKNVTTGKLVEKLPEYSDEYVEPKKFDREAYEARKAREAEIETLSINEYQKVFALQGSQQAEQAFFNKIQELKKVK